MGNIVTMSLAVRAGTLPTLQSVSLEYQSLTVLIIAL